MIPDSRDVAVIGHSYGGDTVAKIVEDGVKVGALITNANMNHSEVWRVLPGL